MYVSKLEKEIGNVDFYPKGVEHYGSIYNYGNYKVPYPSPSWVDKIKRKEIHLTEKELKGAKRLTPHCNMPHAAYAAVIGGYGHWEVLLLQDGRYARQMQIATGGWRNPNSYDTTMYSVIKPVHPI